MPALQRHIRQITSMDQFTDWILVTDENGKIISFSTNPGLVMPVFPRDIVGKHVSEVFPDLASETGAVTRALAGVPVQGEILHDEAILGRTVSTILCGRPIEVKGTIVGAAVFARLVTPVRQDSAHSTVCDYFDIDIFVGTSVPVRRLLSQIDIAGGTPTSVLIWGEMGAGKEHVARAIHQRRGGAKETFFSQDCAGVSPMLLPILLFGNDEKPSRRASHEDGLFGLSQAGTLYLAHLDTMDLALQRHLLSQMGDRPVLASLSTPPQQALAAGTIDESLYYRLSALEIPVPTLRSRQEDLPELVRAFGKSPKGQLSHLKGYPWPGNLAELAAVLSARELPSQIEEIAQLGQGPLVRKGRIVLPSATKKAASRQESLKTAVEQFERAYILEKMEGCRSYAMLAERLGISPQALNYKMKKYGIRFS